MAGFDEVFDEVMDVEGSYDNNLDDRGGETVWGIARNRHSNWPGWHLIDDLRNSVMRAQKVAGHDLTVALRKKLSSLAETDPDLNRALMTHVRMFYQESFWHEMHCDELPDLVAAELFEAGVNCGCPRAVKWLQRALNVLNVRNDEEFYPSVVVDGVMGSKTVEAVHMCASALRADVLQLYQNVQQGMHYIELGERNAGQKSFVYGWGKKRVMLG